VSMPPAGQPDAERRRLSSLAALQLGRVMLQVADEQLLDELLDGDHPPGGWTPLVCQARSEMSPKRARRSLRSSLASCQSALGPWCRSRSMAGWSAFARARPKGRGRASPRPGPAPPGRSSTGRNRPGGPRSARRPSSPRWPGRGRCGRPAASWRGRAAGPLLRPDAAGSRLPVGVEGVHRLAVRWREAVPGGSERGRLPWCG